ncbi:MAG: hypothetical protein H6505_06135, partial [Calditrichaeota bacterium]|nr:hypothetical protein [Calditrichota bacterium]
MKLRMLLIASALMLLANAANAQIQVGLFYDCWSYPPLTYSCDFTGAPLPDGTPIEVFWDADANGPTPNDEQPCVGGAFGCANYNSFSMNGTSLLGCDGGGFGAEENFTINFTTPQPSRYWLRICVPDAPGGPIMWISSVHVAPDGYSEFNLTDANWSCYDSTCGGCTPPPPVTGFSASDNSCTQVTMNWSPYPAEDGVDSLVLFRTSIDTLIGKVHRTATSFTYASAPIGAYVYLIEARRIAGTDTCFSAPASETGTRNPPAIPPTNVTASDNLCSKVLLSWTVPQSIGTIDSFSILRNGTEVKRVRRAQANSTQTDSVFILGSANYAVAGWNEECGIGTPSASDPGNAVSAPAAPTNVTATVGQCTIEINWTPSAGATTYDIYRDGIFVTSDPVPPFSGYEPPAAQTPYTFTVVASNTANPTACQDSPPSAGAIGSDIDAPIAPNTIAASDSVFCTHVVVTWVDASTSEDGFIIRRNSVDIDTVAAGVTTFNDSTAAAGTTYAYTVVSYNACGNSTIPTSNQGSKKQMPPQVTGLTATNNLSDRVTLTWANTIREQGFAIYRDAVLLVAIDSVAADVLTYDDFDVQPNTTYNYQVGGYNECGTGTLSAVAPGSIQATLDAPDNISATDNLCDSVVVTWDDVTNETGYAISRNGSPLGSVGANVTTYTDHTAEPGVVYAYNVASTGPGGPSEGTADNGGAAPLPGVTVFVLDSVSCTEAFITWTSGTNADTIIFYQDGVLLNASLVAGQVTGVLHVTLDTDAIYEFTAVSANECGRGDTTDVLEVQRLQVPDGISDLSGYSVDCASIVVTWTSPANVTDFDVYLDGSPQGSIAYWLDSLIIPASTGLHEVYFVSVNECGDGGTSNVIEVTVDQAPTTPQNVAASSDQCDDVLVTWDAASGDVDGYDILRDGVVINSVGGSELEYTDTPGDSDPHLYAVIATSTTCEDSDTSDTAEGRTLEAVGAVVIAQADDRCGEVSFCWTTASGDLDGYVIYEGGIAIDTVAAPDTCYSHVPAVHAAYAYHVSAYSAICGEGALSNEMVVGYLAQPVAPPNFTATIDRCDAVSLTWDNQPEATAPVVYHLYRDGLQLGGGDVLGNLFIDTGASLGDHSYVIYAVPSAEGCDSSVAALATGTVLPYPEAPTNVVATDTSCSDVHVSWTASTGTYSGYIVYRNGDSLAFVTAPATSYTDTDLEGGASATYAVAAYDEECGTSDLSASDSGTRIEGPEPPANVTASDNSCDNVLVMWDTAPGDVTEYRVYRDATQVGTVIPPMTEYLDTPDAGVYQYTVRAFSTFCGLTNASDPDEGVRLPQMGQMEASSASVDSCNGVLVTWVAYPGATAYRVYRDDEPSSLIEVAAPATEYFDTTPLPGVPHTYNVSAVNVCNEGPLSNDVNGQRAETPDQVTGLTATTTLINEVCLEWNDVDGELNYVIYRGATLIATIDAGLTVYCDGDAVPGVTYTYTVAATNVCGEGDASVGAQGMAVFSLGEVTGLEASTTDCNQICLTWTDIENETGYEILREGQVIATVGQNVTSYCDTEPMPGDCYSYTVRGVNAGGSGPDADDVEGCRRDVPGEVFGVAATSNDCDAVTITWEDVTNEDSYQIWREGTNIATVPANSVSYDDATGVPGQIYFYWVVAVNACGSGDVGNTDEGAIANVPPIVEGVTATANQCSTITVSWTDQALETGYRVYRDGNLTTPIATLGANVTSYANTATTGNHTYQVLAFNECGNGPVSAAAAGTGLAVPGVATAVTAVENCGDITVSWTAPATSPIVEYYVLRDGSQVGTVPVGTTTYSDLNVAAGSHSYRIITANQCGSGAQSAQSNSVTVIPALVQVTGFAAVASNCFCINLSWSNVANETGYYIYCSGVLVDSVGANVTSTTYCPADTGTCNMTVAAYNGCEIGPQSLGISVTPNTYPVAVAGFAASENLCDRVRLTWMPYSDPGVNFFRISRNDVTLAVISSSAVQYEHLGVWPLSTYQIRALRVCAPGDTISMLSADQGRTAPTPVAPSQMDASDNGCGIVTVTFTFANVDGLDSVIIKRNGIELTTLSGGQANVQRQYVDQNPLDQAAIYEVCGVSNLCGEGGCDSDAGAAAPVAGTVTNLAATNDRCNTIILTWTGTAHANQYVVRSNNVVLANVPQGTFTYVHAVT